MIKKLFFFSSILLTFSINFSSAQETSSSLLDEISYVYIEKLIAVAKENYPRVKTLDSKINIAKSRISSAKLGWLSPLSVSYVYSPDNTLNITNPTFFSGYQIGFSLNLSQALQTPATIKQTKEELNVEILNRDEYILSLIREVKNRYFDYLTGVKNLKTQTQNLSDSENIFNLTKHKFEKGEANLQDYNNASTGLATSRQSKIEAEAFFLKAKIALEELIGIRLEEVH